MFPLPHGFMRKDDPPLEKYFGQILQAELVPEAPQDDQIDHIRRILQPVKGCSRAFIKPTPTAVTAKAAVAQRRPVGAFGGSS